MPEIRKSISWLDGILRLSEGESAVHKLHPMAKMLVTAAFIVLALSYHGGDALWILPLWAYPILLTAVSDTPAAPILKRALIALPFTAFGAAFNFIAYRGAAFMIGGFTVTVGMLSFFTIVNKALLSVSAVLILAATTPLLSIQAQLLRLGVPKPLCLLTILTYRYLTTLISEASAMRTAYALRAPDARGVRMGDMGAFLGQLLLRSMDRASRVYQAMVCRGFDGAYRGAPVRRARAGDYVYALSLGAAFVAYRLAMYIV